MKVYVVTAGCYSDFGIEAIFSTKELAEKHMRAYPKTGYDGYNDVDEYELDVFTDEAARGLILFTVQIRRNGDVMKVGNDSYGEHKDIQWMDWEPGSYKTGELPREREWASIAVWAEDETAAVKVANEHRIMAISSEGPL